MKTFLAFLAHDKKIVLLLTAIISEVYSKQQQKQNRYEKFISPNKFLCPMKLRLARRPVLFGSTRKLRKKIGAHFRVLN